MENLVNSAELGDSVIFAMKDNAEILEKAIRRREYQRSMSSRV